MTTSDINGQDYWESRFQRDWIQNEGQRQSQFFGMVACRLFPAWFVEDVKRNSLELCDWGCAMGDGTQVIKSELGLERVAGLDFSVSAIEQARRNYPDIAFATDDLLAEGVDLEFDVIFSSNTLEHFHAPWDTAATLTAHARQYFVMLVPFQEPLEERHEEHFYSFHWHNLRRELPNDFRLVHAGVIDVGLLPDPQYSGKQLLAIYASKAPLQRVMPELIAHGQDLLGRYGQVHDRLVAVDAELEVTILQRNELGSRLEQARRQCDDLSARLEDALRLGDATRREVERLAAEQSRQQGLITELEQGRNDLQHRVLDVETQLRTTQIAEQQASLRAEAGEKRHSEAEKALQALKAENEVIARRLEEVYSSHSWRLTAPFRSIRRLF
ncbi:class I SAM-dependent methyltransferase [Stenotrophomonas maltophilia]|uniref:class I SAM-dependent methyltransferase n=1 Tax=Stenotrophomonas maltophilia TaxID=40324 RepID=UPI0021C7E261|nr:methyltransferase domain-containing protein [Stenotrophomonas maltophilia]MCU1065511.1 methyltransferase domain-containing protein [Stenotrophomonas maltophilia]MCU1075861.1 methyltransferase domain-containing protein [Stenotrophomonas maltophilia]MCU1140516.1 methyltransferase domain-containing protein [Stenotrophomonas maltophilia]